MSFVKKVPSYAQVLNQSRELVNYNVFLSDGALRKAVRVFGGSWGEEHLTNIGKHAGSDTTQQYSRQANTNPPVFKPYDRFGRRQDVVEFHPGYHATMALGIETAQLQSFAWTHAGKPAAQVVRGAGAYMLYQAEAGTQCPQTMTFAAFPVLAKYRPEEKDKLLEKMKVYDPRNAPQTQKRGIMLGMSMTEKQGGSDVRANTTEATPINPSKTGPNQGYLLNGHKWFTSAPMCDAFLTLAKTTTGLSCFLVPRWLPDESYNTGLTFLRLKEKLGDRSNASSEVEYREAYGEMLGEEGRGVATIIEMVHHTRLDCTLGSAGLIRRCVMEATQHTRWRSAFGTRLFDAPLMRAVLAHLVVESEAATLQALFIASLFDDKTPRGQALSRLATAVAKYYTCKRAPAIAYEAMECLGGNGYIDDSPMPYLFRQSPLNAIWEGSGNVICLDILRSVTASPQSLAFLTEEIFAGLDKTTELGSTVASLSKADMHPAMLRRTVETLAAGLQASLLHRFGRPEVAAAFHDLRKSVQIGTLSSKCNIDAILQPYDDLADARFAECYQ
eukprot:m.35192 g.35192  ORF g.35192 m.35192 type:complete len:557 (+) comp9577_c0_seq1:136-1806(+)